jgi:hypothetical protein
LPFVVPVQVSWADAGETKNPSKADAHPSATTKPGREAGILQLIAHLSLAQNTNWPNGPAIPESTRNLKKKQASGNG